MENLSENVAVVSEPQVEAFALRSVEEVEYRLIVAPDEWLDASYQLLSSEFDAEVLDPYERYVEWLELNRQKKHHFPFLMVAAYLRDGVKATVVGVISGNIMRIEEYAGANPNDFAPIFMYAIGHQVTSKILRGRALRGLGTNLWKAAMKHAKDWITELGGKYAYSMLESEPESVGFWHKMGYRWTQDVPYWQPPLEFYPNGDFIHAEVPETLMLCPLDEMNKEAISKTLLKNIIATVFLNW